MSDPCARVRPCVPCVSRMFVPRLPTVSLNRQTGAHQKKNRFMNFST
jgi:hypothetical protein